MSPRQRVNVKKVVLTLESSKGPNSTSQYTTQLPGSSRVEGSQGKTITSLQVAMQASTPRIEENDETSESK